MGVGKKEQSGPVPAGQARALPNGPAARGGEVQQASLILKLPDPPKAADTAERKTVTVPTVSPTPALAAPLVLPAPAKEAKTPFLDSTRSADSIFLKPKP